MGRPSLPPSPVTPSRGAVTLQWSTNSASVSTRIPIWDCDSSRISGFLRRHGVRPGDVVAVQLPNWYEMVAIAIGIFKAGAVINPMLPVYRSKELRYMLRVGETKVVFTPATYRGFDHLAMVEEMRDELPSLVAHVVVDGIGGRATMYVKRSQ